jgi:hypothetical protein
MGGPLVRLAGMTAAVLLLSASCGDDSGPHDVRVLTATERAPTDLLVSVAECHGAPYDVTVTEDAEEVRLRVRASNRSEDSCADGTPVELPSPLDGRRLVDDTTGDEVPVH